MKIAKTMNERATRQMAEQAVDLFLEVLFKSDEDAGWQGDSIIGKLMDFKGELPQSSGHRGFSQVWEKAQLLGHWSDAHKMACIMVRELSDRKREAVAIDRSYRGRVKVAVDPFVPDERVEILWDDQLCAELLDCSVNAFVKRISQGYQDLAAMLEGEIQKAA